MSAIGSFWLTLRTMFRPPFTQRYPEQDSELVTTARFHGRHQLNRWPDGLEKCVGCALCAAACPADAIYIEADANTDTERYTPGERFARTYQINYARCIFCGLCVEACPTRALTMTNEFKLADVSRESLIYGKEDLLTPLTVGMIAPPHDRMLGLDAQEYFAGLPASGEPDKRIPSMDGYRPPGSPRARGGR